MDRRQQPAPIRASLLALNGDLAGKRYRLRMEQYVGVLHCSDSEIAYSNSKLLVSRHHLRIFFVDGRFVMEDCGSRHGSFWNRERVASHVLAHGDLIGAGQAELLFEIDAVVPTSTP